MKTVDCLDPTRVLNEINANPTWWSAEGEGRRYVRIGEDMSITKGRYGMVASMDEWRTIVKLLDPDVLDAIKGMIEDYDDMKRMDIRYCYGDRKSAI